MVQIERTEPESDVPTFKMMLAAISTVAVFIGVMLASLDIGSRLFGGLDHWVIATASVVAAVAAIPLWFQLLLWALRR